MSFDDLLNESETDAQVLFLRRVPPLEGGLTVAAVPSATVTVDNPTASRMPSEEAVPTETEIESGETPKGNGRET